MGFKCFLQHAGRGPGAGAGDRQQRPAPGRWRLGMREASTRTGPSLLALSNIGTGCEITWVLRNRPPASSHLPLWDLTPRTKHLMMTQHTPKKVKQRKRKKNQKATRPHVFPGEWCTLNAEVTSWRWGRESPSPTRTGRGTGRCGKLTLILLWGSAQRLGAQAPPEERGLLSMLGRRPRLLGKATPSAGL